MMPDLASGVQQSPTIIEIRPYRGGGQCFEAAGNRVPVAPGSRALGLTGYRLQGLELDEEFAQVHNELLLIARNDFLRQRLETRIATERMEQRIYIYRVEKIKLFGLVT